jgi:hypothetical protein
MRTGKDRLKKKLKTFVAEVINFRVLIKEFTSRERTQYSDRNKRLINMEQ